MQKSSRFLTGKLQNTGIPYLLKSWKARSYYKFSMLILNNISFCKYQIFSTLSTVKITFNCILSLPSLLWPFDLTQISTTSSVYGWIVMWPLRVCQNVTWVMALEQYFPHRIVWIVGVCKYHYHDCILVHFIGWLSTQTETKRWEESSWASQGKSFTERPNG